MLKYKKQNGDATAGRTVGVFLVVYRKQEEKR